MLIQVLWPKKESPEDLKVMSRDRPNMEVSQVIVISHETDKAEDISTSQDGLEGEVHNGFTKALGDLRCGGTIQTVSESLANDIASAIERAVGKPLVEEDETSGLVGCTAECMASIVMDAINDDMSRSAEDAYTNGTLELGNGLKTTLVQLINDAMKDDGRKDGADGSSSTFVENAEGLLQRHLYVALEGIVQDPAFEEKNSCDIVDETRVTTFRKATST